MASATVSAVCIPRGRRRTHLSMAKAGNWVLLDGVDQNIAKTATITSVGKSRTNASPFGGGAGGGGGGEEDLHIFAPLKFPQVSVLQSEISSCLFVFYLSVSGLCRLLVC